MADVLNNKTKLIILSVFLFLLALVPRIYKISEYPVSMSMDEVAIGYNAYSILKTGYDEWGAWFPLAFKSAFDYKPPVDVYLTIPSIVLFGLNEFAVRLPVVLLGSMLAVVVFLLLLEFRFSLVASFFSGVVVSFSPWLVHFSRGSFEAVTGLFTAVLGTLLFVRYIAKGRINYLYFSIVSISISVWSYHAERFFTPLLILFLLILYRKESLRNIKKTTLRQRKITLGLILLFAVPFVYLLVFTPAIRERAASTSIMRDVRLTNTLHRGDYENVFEFVFDNNLYLISRHWLGKYLAYYDLRFIFWKGLAMTPPEYPGIGLLYLVNLPLFLLGVYSLIKSKNEKFKKITLFWFFAGPLPASLTINDLHPLRSLIWFPFFVFTLASGVQLLVEKKKLRIFIAPYLVGLILNIFYFSDIYFKQFPKYFSEYWQYGYKQVANYACQNVGRYDNIVISETFGSKGPLNTGIPSYYVLFYCEYDREHFIKYGKHAKEFLFHRPNYISDNKLTNSLRIGSTWDFDGEVINNEDIIQRFYFKNGTEAFIAVDKQVQKAEK